jgi:hypothetical protein
MKKIILFAFLFSAGMTVQGQGKSAVITAGHSLDIARPSETIEVSWKDIQDLRLGLIPDMTEVRDADTKKLVVSQNLDLDGNGKPETLVFQWDFRPDETKKFILQKAPVSMRTRFEAMSKTYGRFVPDRYDDYAWENDKTAHRIYGQALMTWEKEPLTSSGIDIWCKNTPNLIVNKWYAGDDYHRDHGEGADMYSVGPTRGVGGLGIWDGRQLYSSKNFKTARTLANGPVCTIFELTYDSWQANGFTVSEIKRIRIDGGRQLNRMESAFKTKPVQKDMMAAAGLTMVQSGEFAFDAEQGWMAYWHGVKAAPETFLGLAVAVDPAVLKDIAKDERNNLALLSVTAGRPLVYYAGGAWTKAGDIRDFQSWQAYLSQWCRRTASPVRVRVSVE